MTVREVAQALGVSKALVYELCAAGKIRHVRFGLGRGTIRIDPEAVEEYRRSCERQPVVSNDGSPLKHIKL